MLNLYCNMCKIDRKNIFFFHGGKNKETNKVTGEAFIADFDSNKVETLRNGPKVGCCGPILKDNKIYIFGGWNENCYSLELSFTFDFSSQEWIQIHNLPQKAAQGVTTALFDKSGIILCGYEHDRIYLYDDVKYTSLLTLESGANSYKILVEGWVFYSNKLFEYLGMETT